jgi:hypothetical protein
MDEEMENMVEQQAAGGKAPVMEEGAEQQAAQSASNPFAGRLKKRYPDKEFADDEEVNGALGEYMDELENYQSSTEEANKKLMEVLQEAPELVSIIKDVSQGATFTEALSRHVDVDELKPMEGDPDYDAWNANIETRKKSRAERESRSKMYQENLEMSTAEIKAFKEESGMSEEDTGKFLTALNDLIGEVVDGKLTRKTLARMKKAVDYDMDVQTAAKQGEVAGKNAQIDTMKEKKAKKMEGDGLPNLTGQGSEVAETPKREKSPWDDAIDMETSRRKKLV